MNHLNSRRKFLQNFVHFSSALLGMGFIAGACNSNNNEAQKKQTNSSGRACDDFRGVSDDDLKSRQKLGYVENSPLKNKRCGTCNLYLPPSEGKGCGGCALFKGPV